MVDDAKKSYLNALRFNFTARKVFLVLGSENGKPVDVKILLNGKPVTDAAGADVKNSTLSVDHEMLYELINQDVVKSGLLNFKPTSRLQAYAFTFGG